MKKYRLNEKGRRNVAILKNVGIGIYVFAGLMLGWMIIFKSWGII